MQYLTGLFYWGECGGVGGGEGGSKWLVLFQKNLDLQQSSAHALGVSLNPKAKKDPINKSLMSLNKRFGIRSPPTPKTNRCLGLIIKSNYHGADTIG